MPYTIVELEAEEAKCRLHELSDILIDAVDSGASVSFMLPPTDAEAAAYWHDVLAAVADGRTILLAALLDNRAVGTVQLCLSTPPNQLHRAEVAKLLVHRAARRQGIGRALMERIEEIARRCDRTLLTLDTWTGSVADRLYCSLGYVRAGKIPGYARLSDGSLGETSIFYKQLNPL